MGVKKSSLNDVCVFICECRIHHCLLPKTHLHPRSVIYTIVLLLTILFLLGHS